MAETLQELLAFAHEIAWQAGKITLRYFQTGIAIDRKADESPVTVADRESEAYLRAAITARYPDHALLGEEEGATGSVDAEWRWIIDPIDGTKSFVRGVPLYGVLIGVLQREVPMIGVVNMPALGEIVYGRAGSGLLVERATVPGFIHTHPARGAAGWNRAHGYEHYGKHAPFQRLLGQVGLFRTWGDCYAYVLVATGRADVAIDPQMNIWDAAALLPILQEAGGTYTDWHGTPTIAGGEGLGTNGVLLGEVLQLMRQEP